MFECLGFPTVLGNMFECLGFPIVLGNMFERHKWASDELLNLSCIT